MSTPPTCGAQQPGSEPSPFTWWPFVAVPAAGGALAWIATHGIPIINGIVGASGTTAGFSVLTAGAAGAIAVCVLVLYYALQADGCIVSATKGEPICVSGIVEDTTDENSTAIDVLAPFAMGPAGAFDLVVKSIYWKYVTQNSYWVFCDSLGAAMLPCIIKSETACGGKIGSVAGAAVGAVGGVILGYIAAAAVGGAIGCAASGPFYLLCLLVVLIVAAIVAAVVAYAGAVIGGWIGEGIAAAANSGNTVVNTWQGLNPGDIVTAQGNWITDPNVGNNELLYTTSINQTGNVGVPAPYTTAQADATAPDDCPVAPAPIQ